MTFKLITFRFQVILVLTIYAVVARPTESTSAESVDVRQGWNKGHQHANSYPIAQAGAGHYSDPGATGSYAAGNSNSRPSYAYDNTFPDQVNFAGADAHRVIASMFTASNGGFVANPVQNQVTGFAPTGYQAPAAVSASASAVSVSS